MANLDLNLLVIFEAIMQEQSITAAAQRLYMTQPSVSNAVTRMRHAWGDPLFVKEGRGIKPTPYAQNLWQQISGSLTTIRQATQKESFNVARTERTFRIALTDWMADIFWLPIRKLIEQEAPGLNIHAVPYAVNAEQLLLDAEVDLVLDYYAGSSPHVKTQWIFDNHFVCAMGAQNPLANKDLSLEEFINAEHLLMSLSGKAYGSVDEALKKQNAQRRIAMTVNHFSNIPKILQGTNLITTIPLPIIFNSVNDGKLVISDPPIEISPGPISMTWHNRLDQDQAMLWLRDKIQQVIKEDLQNHLFSYEEYRKTKR
jgi:DNA-binding transcriptional LysR family regulator